MRREMAEVEQVLDSLDKVAGRDPEAVNRRSTRRRWRKPLKVMVTHPGGNQRSVEVVTRNLSSNGLSFLYAGFLHMGTRCELQLITSDNAWVDIQATVVRCRYVTGRIHEVGLSFDQPVDDGQFVSEKLNARILLVDDSEDVLRLTGHFLRKAGAEIVTANRGVRALKLVREQDFNLVLLDIEMPGINGTEVAKSLRDRGVTIPIIAYTAREDEATRMECLASGCCDVLVKPVGRADLIDTVAHYLAVEEPLISRFAGDPEMTDFIHDFVTALPVKIRKMLELAQAHNADELAPMARQLKVAASEGGGSGFVEISDAADALAKTLTDNVDWRSVEEAMTKLSNLSHRVKETAE